MIGWSWVLSPKAEHSKNTTIVPLYMVRHSSLAELVPPMFHLCFTPSAWPSAHSTLKGIKGRYKWLIAFTYLNSGEGSEIWILLLSKELLSLRSLPLQTQPKAHSVVTVPWAPFPQGLPLWSQTPPCNVIWSISPLFLCVWLSLKASVWFSAQDICFVFLLFTYY